MNGHNQGNGMYWLSLANSRPPLDQGVRSAYSKVYWRRGEENPTVKTGILLEQMSTTNREGCEGKGKRLILTFYGPQKVHNYSFFIWIPNVLSLSRAYLLVGNYMESRRIKSESKWWTWSVHRGCSQLGTCLYKKAKGLPNRDGNARKIKLFFSPPYPSLETEDGKERGNPLEQ